ncbi:unnamed protein product, partial [Owenia fusiformis]
QPIPVVPRPNCQWGQWTRWVQMEQCVWNGSPPTQQCPRPGVARSQRSRRCYCNGREADPRLCGGSPTQQHSIPCCVDRTLPPPPGCGIWGDWVVVPGKCDPPAGCIPLDPAGRKREIGDLRDKRQFVCVVTKYKCEKVRQCKPCPGPQRGCVGAASKTEDRTCCKEGPTPPTKATTAATKATKATPTTKKTTPKPPTKICPIFQWGQWVCIPLTPPTPCVTVIPPLTPPFGCIAKVVQCSRTKTCTPCGDTVCPVIPEAEIRGLTCCLV